MTDKDESCLSSGEEDSELKVDDISNLNGDNGSDRSKYDKMQQVGNSLRGSTAIGTSMARLKTQV